MKKSYPASGIVSFGYLEILQRTEKMKSKKRFLVRKIFSEERKTWDEGKNLFHEFGVDDTEYYYSIFECIQSASNVYLTFLLRL